MRYFRSRLRKIKQHTSQDNESIIDASGKKVPPVGVDILGIELSVKLPQSAVEKEADYASIDDPPLAKQSDFKGSTVVEMKKENEYQ